MEYLLNINIRTVQQEDPSHREPPSPVTLDAMRAGNQTHFPARKQVVSVPDRLAAKPLAAESSNTPCRKISSSPETTSTENEFTHTRSTSILDISSSFEILFIENGNTHTRGIPCSQKLSRSESIDFGYIYIYRDRELQTESSLQHYDASNKAKILRCHGADSRKQPTCLGK